LVLIALAIAASTTGGGTSATVPARAALGVTSL
jgi:hypothetical protein